MSVFTCTEFLSTIWLDCFIFVIKSTHVKTWDPTKIKDLVEGFIRTKKQTFRSPTLGYDVFIELKSGYNHSNTKKAQGIFFNIGKNLVTSRL